MNTIDVIKSLVSQMTPTFNIQNKTVIDAETFKLENCKTFWLTECFKFKIDGNDYVVDELKFNEYIIIKGTVEPIVTSFELEAPHFDYGTHRTVNTERSIEENQQSLITPFVYLMELMREVENTDDDSPIERVSDLRIFFLDNHDEDGDSLRDTVQEKVVKPMHSMADVFRDLILQQENNFDNPKSWPRYTWFKFGTPEVWGNKQCIFDEHLSGVELRFSLPILDMLGCDEFCAC